MNDPIFYFKLTLNGFSTIFHAEQAASLDEAVGAVLSKKYLKRYNSDGELYYYSLNTLTYITPITEETYIYYTKPKTIIRHMITK